MIAVTADINRQVHRCDFNGIRFIRLPLGVNRHIAGHIGLSGKGIACTVRLGIPAIEQVAGTGRIGRRQVKVIYSTVDLVLHHDTRVGLGIAAVLVKNHADTVGYLPHIIVIRAVGISHAFKEPCTCYGIRIAQHKHILRGGVCVFL